MKAEMSAATPSVRLPWIDAARGIAILAMVVYHFSWDLGHFGFIATDVAIERGWVVFARLIAGSFLLLVGVSLVLAARNGIDRRGFLIRLGMIVAGAAAVSVGTWFAMPQAFVFFGILHLIAVSSVLGLLFLRLPALVLLVIAAAIFAAWWYVSDTLFDQPRLLWIGLGTVPPVTNDYTPIFPWFGVVLAGMGIAKLALRSERLVQAFASSAPRPLTLAGRHSLAIYLIHQPVLFGLVWLAAQTIPPSIETFRVRHQGECSAQCVAANANEEFCERACECVGEKIAAEEGLWQDFVRRRFDAEDDARARDLVEACIQELDVPPGM
jgi:uncharacterized membrane protein